MKIAALICLHIGAVAVEQPFRVPPSAKSSEGRNLEAREKIVVAVLALSRQLFFVCHAVLCTGARGPRFCAPVNTDAPMLCTSTHKTLDFVHGCTRVYLVFVHGLHTDA